MDSNNLDMDSNNLDMDINNLDMDNYLEWYPNLDWLLNMASHNILFHPNKKNRHDDAIIISSWVHKFRNK